MSEGREKWDVAWRCARMYLHGREPECWEIANNAAVLDLMHDAIGMHTNAHVRMYSRDILDHFRNERRRLEERLFWENENAPDTCK